MFKGIILIVALLAMTFFGVCTSGNNGGGPRGAVAKVGGDVITASEFRFAYEQAKNQMPSDQREGIAGQVVRSLVDQQIQLRAAKRIGIGVSRQEVMNLVSSIDFLKREDGSIDAEKFKNFLASRRQTEASFERAIKKSIILSKLAILNQRASFVSSKGAGLTYQLMDTMLSYDYVKISPETVKSSIDSSMVTSFMEKPENKVRIKKYFDDNKDSYNVDAGVKLRQILISYAGAKSAHSSVKQRTKEQAMEIANKVEEDTKKEGANFAAIARLKTDNPSEKTRGGDLGWVGDKDVLPEKVKEVALSLKKSQVSGVIESAFGFHVLYAENVRQKKVADFEQEKSNIASKLFSEQESGNLILKVAAEIEATSSSPEQLNTILSKYALTWQQTGEIRAGINYIPGIGADTAVLNSVSNLTEINQMTPPLKVGSDTLFIKLKSKKMADMAKFDGQMKERINYFSQNLQSKVLASQYINSIKNNLESEGRIDMNAHFMNIDNQQSEN